MLSNVVIYVVELFNKHASKLIKIDPLAVDTLARRNLPRQWPGAIWVYMRQLRMPNNKDRHAAKPVKMVIFAGRLSWPTWKPVG